MNYLINSLQLNSNIIFINSKLYLMFKYSNELFDSLFYTKECFIDFNISKVNLYLK